VCFKGEHADHAVYRQDGTLSESELKWQKAASEFSALTLVEQRARIAETVVKKRGARPKDQVLAIAALAEKQQRERNLVAYKYRMGLPQLDKALCVRPLMRLQLGSYSAQRHPRRHAREVGIQ
jgi:hypothetical protein